jgi:predicted dehydrogenase
MDTPPNPLHSTPSAAAPPLRRLALIGAGAIAADHADAIDATPGLQLTRVVDRHADRARRLAARYGATPSTDPADLLTADVDAVIVCTSPGSHVPIAVDALRAGKAVLLEKPVALDVDSVDHLLEVAATTGGPLLIGQTARFQPAHLEVARAIADGRVGRPRLAHVTWYAGHVWPGGWRSWQLDPAHSGGHVLHNGVHALDLLSWLLDDVPARVFARPMPTWSEQMPTPDSFSVIVEFTGGGLGVIELSYGLQARGTLARRLLVSGTGGSVSVDTDEEPRSTMFPAPPPVGVLDAMRNQYAHFRDVLVDGVPPWTTPRHIRGALAGAVAAQRSADTGLVVAVEGDQ